MPFAALQKRITRKSVPKKLLREAPELWEALEHEVRRAGYGGPEQFLAHPERYAGVCAEKTQSICETYRTHLQQWKEER